MTIALVSLLILIGILVFGIVRSDMNLGLIALAAALLIGIYAADLSVAVVAELFPSQLFLMLTGVTLFFAIAQQNGTILALSQWALYLIRGKAVLLPFLFFFLTAVLSAVGPGNIAATAFVAPVGMSVAFRFGLNPLLMAIMICTGANAGTFSLVAPTGVINQGLVEKIGVYDTALLLRVFGMTAFLQSLSAVAAFFVFRGHRGARDSVRFDKPASLTRRQWHVAFAMIGLLFLVLVFDMAIVIAALVLAEILFLFKYDDHERAIKALPWSIILLVTGITVLIGIVEKTGGLDLATTWMASNIHPGSGHAMMTLVSSVISVFSSSSGVVLPTMIPLIPSYLQKLGQGELASMIIAVDVGSHMVDVSPLSTLGALCLAAYEGNDRVKLFRGLLAWGLAMVVVSTVLSYLFLDFSAGSK